MKQISKATFDTDTLTVVITGVADTQIYITGIVIENNEDADVRVRLVLNSPAEDQYGDGNNGVYLNPYGHWGLPMTRDSIKYPYFISTDTGTHFIIYPIGGRVAGAVWYFQE